MITRVLFASSVGLMGICSQFAHGQAAPFAGSLAFAREFAYGDCRVFVADFPSCSELALPHSYGIVNHPRWSPDGRWIAVHAGPGGDAEIYLIRPDGSDVYPVTPGLGLGDVLCPEWSPGGRHLAFFSGPTVFAIHPDGTHLTNHGDNMTLPIWGASGECVIVGDWDGSFPSNLFRYDVVDAALTQLTFAEETEAFARGVESRDGSSILSTRLYSAGGRSDIVLINAADNAVTNLTADMTGLADYATWVPDGSYIVFASNQDGTWDIWAMRPDGSDKVKLCVSTDTYDEHSPHVWQPTFCPADFNHDIQIDTRDVLAFLNAWSTGCP